MAALTWRNVDTPNLAPAIAGMNQFSQLLGQAFGGAATALDTFDESKTEKVSNEFIQNLLTDYSGSPEAMLADLQSGKIFEGVDRKRLNQDALNLLAKRPEDLLRFATTELQRQDTAADLDWQNTERGWTTDDRNNMEAAKPQVTRMLEAAASGDEKKVAAVSGSREYIEAIGKLPPAMQMEIAKGGISQVQSLLELESERIDQAGGRLDNAGKKISNETNAFSLGNAKEDRAAETVGLGIGSRISSMARNGEEALLALESDPTYRNANPRAQAVARGQLNQNFGNIYAPAEIVSSGSLEGSVSGDGYYGGGWQLTPGQTPGAARPGGRVHNGWDLSGMTVGTPVAAPMDGKVIKVKPNNGNAGNTVTVQYANGKTNTFMHLDSIGVREGQSFSAGSTLGAAGNTGNASTKGTNRAVLHVEGTAGLMRGMSRGASPAIEAAASTAQVANNSAPGRWAQNLSNEADAGEVADALRASRLQNVPKGWLTGKLTQIVKQSVNSAGVATLTYAQAGELLARSARNDKRGMVDRLLSGDLIDPDGVDINLGNGTSLDSDFLNDAVREARNGRPQDRAGAIETIQASAAQLQAAQGAVRSAEMELQRLYQSGRPSVIAANRGRLQAKVTAARNQLEMIRAAAIPAVQSSRQTEEDNSGSLFSIKRR